MRGLLVLDTDADWTFSIDIDCIGLDTFTMSGVSNAIDAMDSLVLWANGLLRPWFGVTVFSWEWTRYLGRGAPRLVSSGALFDYLPDATAIATLGIAAEMGTFYTTSTTGASGCWYPAAGVSVGGWLRSLPEGDAAGIGAVREGVPGLGKFAPSVQAWATASEAAILPGILRAASRPRVGSIWHEAPGVYRRLAIGDVTRDRMAADVYAVKIAARGEAL